MKTKLNFITKLRVLSSVILFASIFTAQAIDGNTLNSPSFSFVSTSLFENVNNSAKTETTSSEKKLKKTRFVTKEKKPRNILSKNNSKAKRTIPQKVSLSNTDTDGDNENDGILDDLEVPSSNYFASDIINRYPQTKTSAKVPLTPSKDHALEEPIFILKKQLTYGQVLNLDKLADAVTWVINGPSSSVSGGGNALNDYVFVQPGDYQISLKENVTLDNGHVCQSHVPSRIELKVAAVKMTFHPDELELSADIRKGVDTQGISMQIPVTIASFGEQKLDYAFQSVTTSGLDTHIVGTLKKGTVLHLGKQILQYELSGVANKQAYIQFDFTDINGEVQIAVPKKIVQ